jgi:hypothetical protein
VWARLWFGASWPVVLVWREARNWWLLKRGERRAHWWRPDTWWQPGTLRFRRRARWQRKTTVANLRRFWDEMGARARNRDLKEASSDARGGE